MVELLNLCFVENLKKWPSNTMGHHKIGHNNKKSYFDTKWLWKANRPVYGTRKYPRNQWNPNLKLFNIIFICDSLFGSPCTMQNNKIPCNTIKVPCNTITNNQMQYNAMQYDAMQYHAMQSKTIQYMQYKEIPCNTLFKSFETSTGPMGFVFSSWMVPYGL